MSLTIKGSLQKSFLDFFLDLNTKFPDHFRYFARNYLELLKYLIKRNDNRNVFQIKIYFLRPLYFSKFSPNLQSGEKPATCITLEPTNKLHYTGPGRYLQYSTEILGTRKISILSSQMILGRSDFRNNLNSFSQFMSHIKKIIKITNLELNFNMNCRYLRGYWE
jgi:hypothetical protein